ncbi:DxFTY motif-containing membrane protein [Spiroplasma endosymbiont of Amphibalanus improvisus]|uniref:DxFTY motif-containing membrane protein n=1 Tax=Spiroplasma endosymbiont of Amphibalanus improvisus TaxID=3066327 RepID=UPI00313CB572
MVIIGNAKQGIDVSEKVNKRLEFHKEKTIFYKSLIFLFLESFLLCLTFWLLTSPDVSFAVWPNIQAGAAIGYCFALFFIILSLTIFTYVIGLHNHDQIIYNLSLTFVLLGLYVSGYVWDGWDNVFYRLLMTLGFLFLGVIVSVPLSLVLKNQIEYRKSKKIINNNKEKNTINSEEKLEK